MQPPLEASGLRPPHQGLAPNLPGISSSTGASLSFVAVAARATAQTRFPEIQLASKSYGQKDGVPSISFSPAEYHAATKKFEHSLIAKFQVGRPPLPEVRDFMVKNLRLKGKVTISTIWDDRHIVIILDSEEDANTFLASPVRRIGYTLFRLFRWTPALSSRREETRTTKWIRLPELPLELFDRAIIRSIVNSFAHFIDIDEKTKSLTGLSYARACVELDVLEAIPEKVWISLPEDKGFFQDIIVEGNMAYCSRCKKHGHTREACRRSGRETATNKSSEMVQTVQNMTKKNQKLHSFHVTAVPVQDKQSESFSNAAEEDTTVDSQLPISEWTEFKSRRTKKKERRSKAHAAFVVPDHVNPLAVVENSVSHKGAQPFPYSQVVVTCHKKVITEIETMRPEVDKETQPSPLPCSIIEKGAVTIKSKEIQAVSREQEEASILAKPIKSEGKKGVALKQTKLGTKLTMSNQRFVKQKGNRYGLQGGKHTNSSHDPSTQKKSCVSTSNLNDSNTIKEIVLNASSSHLECQRVGQQ